jgi:hypothetical protein
MIMAGIMAMASLTMNTTIDQKGILMSLTTTSLSCFVITASADCAVFRLVVPAADRTQQKLTSRNLKIAGQQFESGGHSYRHPTLRQVFAYPSKASHVSKASCGFNVGSEKITERGRGGTKIECPLRLGKPYRVVVETRRQKDLGGYLFVGGMSQVDPSKLGCSHAGCVCLVVNSRAKLSGTQIDGPVDLKAEPAQARGASCEALAAE